MGRGPGLGAQGARRLLRSAPDCISTRPLAAVRGEAKVEAEIQGPRGGFQGAAGVDQHASQVGGRTEGDAEP